MSTTDSGRLGEVKVLARLVELGWYPFTDLSGKCPVDILAWKNGETISVQVKSSDRIVYGDSYSVQIGSVRHNRTSNTVNMFDNTSVDYQAVFFKTPNKVCFFKASEITSKRSKNVRVSEMDQYSEI